MGACLNLPRCCGIADESAPTKAAQRLLAPSTRCRLAAVLADAVDFQGLGLRTEAKRLGLRLDQLSDTLVADFLGALAFVADQEGHLMRFGRVMAGHVGVDRL